MVLGLTGGIATGKSTVSALFQQRGAVVIDADQVARQVVEPGEEGLARIVRQFGTQVLQPDQRLDRTALGRIIFNDAAARQKLNQLLHPLIRQAMQQQTHSILQQHPHAILLWDTPLLIEGNLLSFVEKVIVVYVPESIQLARLMARDAFSVAEAQSRISAQLPMAEKKRVADWVIDNSGTLEQTERQVDQLWNYLTLKNG
jgi:dephospho-CoA kinase